MTELDILCMVHDHTYFKTYWKAIKSSLGCNIFDFADGIKKIFVALFCLISCFIVFVIGFPITFSYWFFRGKYFVPKTAKYKKFIHRFYPNEEKEDEE